MNLLASADNDAVLKWLDEAFEHALKQKRVELWAYLEAVMDDVLFEMELDTRL